MMLFPALEQYYFFYFGGPKSEEPRLCVHSLISNKEGRLSSEYIYFFKTFSLLPLWRTEEVRQRSGVRE